jgi:hypothetical protein
MLLFSRMLPLVSTARMTDSCPRVPPGCAPSGVAPVIGTRLPLMVAEKASRPRDWPPPQAGPDMAMVTPSFPGVGSLSRKSTFSRGFS